LRHQLPDCQVQFVTLKDGRCSELTAELRVAKDNQISKVDEKEAMTVVGGSGLGLFAGGALRPAIPTR